MVDLSFGTRLKTLRLQSGMTQATLAYRLGLTKSVISAYENNLRTPSYDILIAISKIFKVTTDYLLGQTPKDVIDLSGLSLDEKMAIANLVKTMKAPFKFAPDTKNSKE